MNVIVAKTAGFCFGVKRAVDFAYSKAGQKNIYTYGPIIHNKEVTKDLEKKGIKIIDNLLSYYKENGLEKERLSSFIDRVGIQEIKQSVI